MSECPKCGAETEVYYDGYHAWQCGSTWDPTEPKGQNLMQTDKCRIAELEAENAKLAAIVERMPTREQAEEAIRNASDHIHNSTDWWDEEYRVEGRTIIENLLDDLVPPKP